MSAQRHMPAWFPCAAHGFRQDITREHSASRCRAESVLDKEELFDPGLEQRTGRLRCQIETTAQHLHGLTDCYPADRDCLARRQMRLDAHHAVDAHLASFSKLRTMELRCPGRNEYLVLDRAAGHMRSAPPGSFCQCLANALAYCAASHLRSSIVDMPGIKPGPVPCRWSPGASES